MPWKRTDLREQRYELIRRMRVGGWRVAELCRQAGISRKTAYKWKKRYERGRLKSLADQPRAPHRVFGRTEDLWLARVRRLRQRRRTWGARKLRYQLEQAFGARGLPAVATITRWLRRWGLAKGKRRRKLGPIVQRPALRQPASCNEVWTVDFKGSYLIGDKTRVEPLTVRDLYSRYGLLVKLQRSREGQETRRSFIKLFNKYGLPERIRCDNGSPFGGIGPSRLTWLSAWWVKLGITVEFIAPGRPDQNGAHEQFHRIYKKDVARNPAQTIVGQQRRGERWLKEYNEQRHHEVWQEPPGRHYQRSARRLQSVGPWTYPPDWERRWVKGNGEISRGGLRRFVGEAFVEDWVGLEPCGAQKWRVYFGPILLGLLDEKETGNLRMAQYYSPR